MDPLREMQVVKRNGRPEVFSFEKIHNRIKKLGSEAGISLNYSALIMKTADQLHDKISTARIDELMAEQCASLTTLNLDYGKLAARLVISNNQKQVPKTFSKAMHALTNVSTVDKGKKSILGKRETQFLKGNSLSLNKMVVSERDFLIDYFGFKTLERAYLMSVKGVCVESIQYMWLRVSLGIHCHDELLSDEQKLKRIKETYDLMSSKYFTHATPTLFNSGTAHPQLSSCFLLSMKSDSIDGIYNTLKDCANISKWAGGIGLHIHQIRASGSHIHGTNGTSNGLVPMLKVFNNTARYVDQGGGKRNGSFAIYLEPWHSDIFAFLDLKKNHGDEELRARDLFYALWIPDLFMKRVQEDGDWTLMCPHECPGLSDAYGDDFEQLYNRYSEDGSGRETIKARKLWMAILDSQMETGTPYMLYKDACNKKSNQKNLGTIKSSNLCTEIVEYSSPDETAVCNLASIALSSFVFSPLERICSESSSRLLYTKDGCKWCVKVKEILKAHNISFEERECSEEDFGILKSEMGVKTVPQLVVDGHLIGGHDQTLVALAPQFDFEKLEEVTGVVTQNLNNIIDINFYPTPETRNSNTRHRPIGIGVQGLADAFMKMDIAYTSERAVSLNKDIFETIYYAAVAKSLQLAKERGAYSTFAGSPASEGTLQFDMWGVTPSTRYDWASLKSEIQIYGLRNSLLLAPMPTASTSQILGNNECFEPFTSNIYSRRTNAGEFLLVNRYLMEELQGLGLWTEELKNNIIENKGSIQHLDFIPERLREKYKIVWEIPMKHMINLAVDRAPYICQSQSLNLWVEDPNYKTLTHMHLYSWSKGLKTGIYYLRRKPKHQPQQFTIAPTAAAQPDAPGEDEICEACSA